MDVRREWVVTADATLPPITGVHPEVHRELLAGDTLRIDGPLDVVGPASEYVAAHFPQLVPKDGTEGQEWLRQQEKLVAAEEAERKWRDERARRWLLANEVPDFVVDFLRS